MCWHHHLNSAVLQGILFILLANNFIMHEKSCGFSTKSSSNFLGSPFKSLSQHKTFKLEEVEEREAVFLREKNRELQELVLRMGEELGKLSK